MSRYGAQPQLYAQAAYPHASYPPPAMHGYPYQQLPPPPPMPVYHTDPNSFRRDYASRLTELTINSRPIIQNLSMYAQEYSRWAEIVAQCIEAHIRRVPIWMKLPAFYLLDAISKNVFEPYARHFAIFVVALFLDTYAQVDQPTRSKMEEMLLTWRTGSPTGKELFGVVPQVAIERGVWSSDSAHVSDSLSRSGGFTSSTQINKSMVISELEFTLGQKERAVLANPYDTVSQNHIAVLQQLRKLVDAGVSQEELRQILNQLRALMQNVPPPPPEPQALSAPPPHSLPQPAYPTYPASAFPLQAPHSVPNYPQTSYPPEFKAENLDVSTLILAVPATSAPMHGLANTQVDTAGNINDLFRSLLKAGLVSASSTTTGAGSAAPEADKKPPVDSERDSRKAYRRFILAQKIKLNTADLTKTRPQVAVLLYDQLSAQCKQCGIRFSDTSSGKKRMETHLDMHFRQNRKANQNIGRGHSRSWFIGLEDWINDLSTVDVKGKGHAEGLGRPLNAKAAAAAEVSKRDAELRAQYVVVPPGDEAKVISCPICKETMSAEFLEEDEDWVWRNAIMRDDKIYHATCHAEAVASTHNLARLRSEISHSRSQTPEVPTQRRSPPMKNAPLSPKVTGAKRKAEDEQASVKLEPEGTPPLKKFAKALPPEA